MKKVSLVFLSLLLLTACSGNKEEKKILVAHLLK